MKPETVRRRLDDLEAEASLRRDRWERDLPGRLARAWPNLTEPERERIVAILRRAAGRTA